MNDDLAFIDAILKDEADDTARLVYADWLDDHDEPELAAFVRLQTEVYHLPSADPRRLDLRKRETAAWNAYKGKWGRALKLGSLTRSRFKRGVIPDCVAFDNAKFVAEASGWGPGIPIRRLIIWDAKTIDAGFAAWPFLARLTELRLGTVSWQAYQEARRLNQTATEMPVVRPPVVVAIARSPYPARYRRFEVSIVPPSRAMFEALAACSALDRPYFSVELVPHTGWGRPWQQLPLRSFSKPEHVPIADAVRDFLDGPNAEYLID